MRNAYLDSSKMTLSEQLEGLFYLRIAQIYAALSLRDLNCFFLNELGYTRYLDSRNYNTLEQILQLNFNGFTASSCAHRNQLNLRQLIVSFKGDGGVKYRCKYEQRFEHLGYYFVKNFYCTRIAIFILILAWTKNTGNKH